MSHLSSPDLLIVGAGPSGCVIAEQAASRKGWTSLIVEKRTHIGGNCYDYFHESGVMIHGYGPHYFRTNDIEIFEYLSQFTDWIPGDYRCLSVVNGRKYPFPVNLDTLEKFFQRSFTPKQAEEFLARLSLKIPKPENFEEQVLSQIGEELYGAFYKGYTKKQWGLEPNQMDPSVAHRIPLRFNRDDRYLNHHFQFMPRRGYTELFKKMIGHSKIKVILDADYSAIKGRIQPRLATVYTGPVDTYFNYCYGKLLWRSLNFEYTVHNEPLAQPCVQLNYPGDEVHTRSVEYKHVTKQKSDNSVVGWERACKDGDPYYPVPSRISKDLAAAYAFLAESESRTKKVFFCGRLAEYRYINMDEAVKNARETFKKIENSLDSRIEIATR